MKTKLLGNLKKGMLFVVSAPAGTGKTTLVKMLTDEFNQVVPSVSYTTRKPRGMEKEGVDYHFITVEKFEKMMKRDEFLEHAQIYGDYYGTAKDQVEGHLEQGKHVFLVIDTQGGMQLKETVSATFIFISPPSMETLRKRLEKRKTESEAKIDVRLEWSKKEIEAGRKYDYTIINDDLNTAYQVLRSIVIAEEHRQIKNI